MNTNSEHLNAAESSPFGYILAQTSGDASIDALGDYPLHTACRNTSENAITTVKELVKKRKCDVNIKDLSGRTSLHIATKTGNLPIVKYLLQEGAKIDATDKDGKTSIHYAASEGYLNVLKALLALCGNSVGLRQMDNKGYHPLHYSCERGHFKTVEFITEQDGVDLDHISTTGSPLHIATTQGYSTIVDILLSKGANYTKSHKGNTPLDLAIQSSDPQLLNQFLQRNIHSTSGRHDFNYIRNAILNNNISLQQCLVETIDSCLFWQLNYGTVSKKQDNINNISTILEITNYSPFHLAVLMNLTPIIEQFFAKSENAELELNATFTLLKETRLEYDSEEIRSWPTAIYGGCALHISVMASDNSPATFLLVHAADINQKANKITLLQVCKDRRVNVQLLHANALHFSICCGRKDLADLLIGNGIDIDEKCAVEIRDEKTEEIIKSQDLKPLELSHIFMPEIATLLRKKKSQSVPQERLMVQQPFEVVKQLQSEAKNCHLQSQKSKGSNTPVINNPESSAPFNNFQQLPSNNCIAYSLENNLERASNAFVKNKPFASSFAINVGMNLDGTVLDKKQKPVLQDIRSDQPCSKVQEHQPKSKPHGPFRPSNKIKPDVKPKPNKKQPLQLCQSSKSATQESLTGQHHVSVIYFPGRDRNLMVHQADKAENMKDVLMREIKDAISSATLEQTGKLQQMLCEMKQIELSISEDLKLVLAEQRRDGQQQAIEDKQAVIPEYIKDINEKFISLSSQVSKLHKKFDERSEEMSHGISIVIQNTMDNMSVLGEIAQERELSRAFHIIADKIGDEWPTIFERVMNDFPRFYVQKLRNSLEKQYSGRYIAFMALEECRKHSRASGECLDKIRKVLEGSDNEHIVRSLDQMEQNVKMFEKLSFTNVLSDKYFSNLASQLGGEWKRFGIELGFTESDMTHFEHDCNSLHDIIYRMLVKWRDKSDAGSSAKVSHLMTALKDIGKETLIHDMRKFLQQTEYISDDVLMKIAQDITIPWVYNGTDYSWKEVASQLNIANDVIREIDGNATENKPFEMLRFWQENELLDPPYKRNCLIGAMYRVGKRDIPYLHNL